MVRQTELCAYYGHEEEVNGNVYELVCALDGLARLGY